MKVKILEHIDYYPSIKTRERMRGVFNKPLSYWFGEDYEGRKGVKEMNPKLADSFHCKECGREMNVIECIIATGVCMHCLHQKTRERPRKWKYEISEDRIIKEDIN